MVCADCRQPIQGKFLRVGKLAFHPGHFRCRACKQPIDGQFNVHAGMFLHPACFAERHAPRCAICKEPVTGQYVTQDGSPYHERCYGEHLAKSCDVCKKRIVGTSLTDYWGNTYHAEHARQYASCQYCSRLVHPATSGGGTTYPDGRPVCRVCHKTAVHREVDARRVVESVKARMQGWGVDLTGIDVPVRIIDRTQLARYLSGSPHQKVKRVSGLARMNWQREGRQVVGKEATIYLLTGMPLGWLESTAAHELMHVWNFHNGPTHTFALEEGSCNYMSYRVFQERGDDEARYHIDCLMKDPDPAYGAGFRRVKRYVDRQGFERLLTLLRRSADFPLLDGIF